MLLIRPAKGKVLSHLRSVKAYLKTHKQARAEQVVGNLNPLIRGWANYYRHGNSKETFSLADSHTWSMLWRWAKRRHRNKSSRWVKQRYFREDWTFYQGKAHIVRRARTPVTRYVKGKGAASPLDPDLRAYWRDRRQRTLARTTFSRSRLALLRQQKGMCGLCRTPLGADDTDDHHIVQKHAGGANTMSNRMLVHRWRHHAHHQRHRYRA